ncbi:hypothetical protein Tco_0840501 [Tanacetum coccineum]|uniref:Copia protein n=1 Tax=Tanacetum coccineum TaxID=301880 RepID=A0ABQ5AYN6_9ASTR
MKIKESLNVTYNENSPPSKTSPLGDDDLDKEEAIKVTKKKNLENDIDDETLEIDEVVNIKESRNHLLENVIGNLNQRNLRSQAQNEDTKLMKDKECESVDSTKYRGMIGTTHLGLWYPKGTGIETVVYADSDHAGDYADRKSTSGICTFVGCCLTSWFSKKQTALAISTTEAEYVNVKKACQQALWMKKALIDYDIRLDDVPIIRGRPSTSSSSTFGQSSFSHLSDDDNDGNDEGTSCASTPSPTHFVNSLTNEVPRVFSNPPNIDPNMEPFYTRQTEILNSQVQLRDEQRGGIMSIRKGIKNL